jgi:hypothetical protein
LATAAVGRFRPFGFDFQLHEGRQADGQRDAGDGHVAEGVFDGPTQVDEYGADGFGCGHDEKSPEWDVRKSRGRWTAP